MLIIGGGAGILIKFCTAIKPPNVVVLRQEASTIFALGAAALDHSASRMASSSAPFVPGGTQLLIAPEDGWICVKEANGYAVARPKTFRKLCQSARLNTSVDSITTMVCPLPEIPLLKRGLRL